MPGKAFRGTDLDDDEQQGDKAFAPFIYFVIASGGLTLFCLCGFGLYRFCQNPTTYLEKAKKLPTAVLSCCFKRQQQAGHDPRAEGYATIPAPGETTIQQ